MRCDRDPRERREQRAADAVAARRGAHEQILEVEAGLGEERRVALEEQREPDRRAGELGDQDLGGGAHAEQRRAQRGLVGDDLVRQLLVLGELADEAEDRGGVVGGREPDREIGGERVMVTRARRRSTTAVKSGGSSARAARRARR